MARVTTHTKSARGEFNCAGCRKPVNKGEKYFMWGLKTGRGGIIYRQHVSCGAPKRSQLTLSKLSEAYSAIEDAEAQIGTASCFEDIKGALSECSDRIEAVRDEYQDSLDSMPEGLQQGTTGQEMQEKIDALDNFSSSLSSADIPDDDEGTDLDSAPEGLDDAKATAQEVLDGFEL